MNFIEVVQKKRIVPNRPVDGFGTDKLSTDLGRGLNGLGTDELSADLGNGLNGFGERIEPIRNG